jgi:hypothetical protein
MKTPVKGEGVSYSFTHYHPFPPYPNFPKMYVNVTLIFPASYGVIGLTYLDFEDYSRDGKSDYDTMLSTFVLE